MAKRTRPPEVPDSVLAHLRDALGGVEPFITAVHAAILPGGSAVRAFSASDPASPNRVARITVDDAGELRSVVEVERLAGRALFVPEFTAATSPVAVDLPRDPITIDPTRNDWRLNQCERHTEKITVTIPRGNPAKADVYLLADTTGSMEPVIDAVKAGASAILANPSLAGFDVAWGVGNYRDFPREINAYAFQHQQAPSTNTTDAATAISTWSAGEGGDGSEGQLYALHELATNASIGWRPDTRRIVVWFGDAPGHDPICTDVTGLASAITEASVTAELTGAETVVVAVSTTTGFADALDGDPDADAGDYTSCPPAGTEGQATRITAAPAEATPPVSTRTRSWGPSPSSSPTPSPRSATSTSSRVRTSHRSSSRSRPRVATGRSRATPNTS